MVDLLARFRQVGEGGMRLGVGEVQRPRGGGDGAHKALAHLELGEVDGTGIETFGRIEFEHAIGAQHVDGTHFRDHVLRDLAHDLVKALLRLERLRHQFAQPLEKNARTRGEVSHRVASPENNTTLAGAGHAGDQKIGAESAGPYFLSRP